nr:ABC transporter ATP-binding protein [Streptococcus sp.]
AVMYAGKIVEVGTVEEVFYNPQHPYTWGLLNSMPTTETACGSLESIPGTPPDLLNPPVGDAFAARNAYALDIDFEEQPPMFQISDSHYAATWLLDERAPEITPPLAILKRWEKWNSKKEKQ